MPIGGVVQAAMSLSEFLWFNISRGNWHFTVDPKVQETWILHNTMRHQDRDKQVDFFLIKPSISGTVGPATLGNYCAANGFLDSFARFQNGLALPAVSVGLDISQKSAICTSIHMSKPLCGAKKSTLSMKRIR